MRHEEGGPVGERILRRRNPNGILAFLPSCGSASTGRHLCQEGGPVGERVLRCQHAGRLHVQRAAAAPQHPVRHLHSAVLTSSRFDNLNGLAKMRTACLCTPPRQRPSTRSAICMQDK